MDCKFSFIVGNHPSNVSFKQISDNACILTIPNHTAIQDPIELNFNHSEKELEFFLTVEMGEGSKATIIERFENKITQNIYYHHQVNAGSNSSLKLITFQNLTEESRLTEIREVRNAKSAHVHHISFQLGAKKIRSSIKQNALGRSGDLNIDLLSRTHLQQDHQFNLTNIFQAQNGRGKILAKGIALDESKLTLNGTIQIDQQGSGTDTYLKQDSLLLSPSATIKATPGLKIDTNDVKAGHGASVINLNDESLFYLTSRGIDKAMAKKMMINGFVAEQLDKISELPELKKTIQTLI
ncbi:SufD family Fe-S cluster assembly protein [Candidatus Pacearchaeota archaeon]|nr:SufD family Fe-S cluster assembly protein [Candidatus Pacearchaeota archaeon]